MDMVAQFITSLRNAGLAGHEKVDVPSSNLRKGIANVLLGEGYIKSFKVAKDSKQGIMRVYLKYNDSGKPMIDRISRVSTPGRRVYKGSDELGNIRSGYGISILSTNVGVISNKQAKQLKVGGEVLCEVW